MAHSFGSTTGDDSTFTNATSWLASSTVQVVCGWWYPTTLTAGRYYWGRIISGLSVAPTTSELRYTADFITTDGIYTTSGAGIAVNRWWFIACASFPSNTGPRNGLRFWVGDDAGNLFEVPFAQDTAPVGNANSSSSFTIGNQGSATSVAFQGLIGWTHMSAWASPLSSPIQYQNATIGIFTDGEAEQLFTRHVQPMYRLGILPGTNFAPPTTSSVEHLYNNYNIPTRTGLQYTVGTWRTTGPLSASGATYTEDRQPCPDPRFDVYRPNPCGRRRRR